MTKAHTLRLCVAVALCAATACDPSGLSDGADGGPADAAPWRDAATALIEAGGIATGEIDASRVSTHDAALAMDSGSGLPSDPDADLRELLGLSERMQLPFIPGDNPLTPQSLIAIAQETRMH
jgi:hypothetical protein